jgi:hypothetical protein
MKAPYTKSGRSGNTVYQRARYGQISYPYHKLANPNWACFEKTDNEIGSFSLPSHRNLKKRLEIS